MSTTTTQPSAPAPSKPPSKVRSVFTRIGVQNISLVIALVVLSAVIGIQDPNFFRVQNLLAIGTSITVFGILAIVQTLVILLGALDISVGSVAGLTSVVSAMVFTATTQSVLSIGSAILVGLLCGAVNGIIIVYGRVNPVVATLATLAAFKGLAQLVSGGRSQGYTGGGCGVHRPRTRHPGLGIPVLIYIFAILGIVVALVLKYTDIGRNIYAIGGNPTAARLSGISLNRYIIGVYILVGAVAGLAGVLLTARTGSGQPVSGSEGLELEAITAAAPRWRGPPGRQGHHHRHRARGAPARRAQQRPHRARGQPVLAERRQGRSARRRRRHPAAPAAQRAVGLPT